MDVLAAFTAPAVGVYDDRLVFMVGAELHGHRRQYHDPMAPKEAARPEAYREAQDGRYESCYEKVIHDTAPMTIPASQQP